MRLTNVMLGGFVLGALVLAGCGEDGADPLRGKGADNGSSPTGPGGTSPTGTSSTPSATDANGCPSSMALPATVLQDGTVSELQLVNGEIYAKGANAMIHVKKDGSGRQDLYANGNLTHFFVDGTQVMTIEASDDADNPDNTTLNIFNLTDLQTALTSGNPPTAAATTTVTWNAAGSHIFASDPGFYYALADTNDGGETVYQIPRDNPGGMTAVAQIANATLSDAQLVNGDVWFVRDAKRVYRVTPGGDDGAGGTNPASEPQEIFASGQDCKLAVGGGHAFCSTGGTVEQRDLTGGAASTFFDAKSTALLGDALYANDSLVVSSLPTSPSDSLKNGIRGIKGASDVKVLACGRNTIVEISADTATVAWIEQGVGIFSAPR